MRRTFLKALGLLLALGAFVSTGLSRPVLAAEPVERGDLCGVVRSTEGKVIPGASVRLSREGRSAKTTTNGDGYYEFLGLPAGRGYGLRVEAAGFKVAEQGPITVLAGQKTKVDFALIPLRTEDKGAIVGVVRADGGEGIAGAKVEILSGPSDGRTITAKGGRFVLRGLKGGVYALSVSALGFATKVVEGIEVVSGRGTEVRIVLQRVDGEGTGAIFGVVRNGEGAPIPGATVAIVVGPSGGETTTDADGKYVLANLAPGRYALKASAEGYVPQVQDGLELRAGEEKRVDFSLRRAEARFGVIEGQVTNREGTPIAGATVAVVVGPTPRSVTTNEEGRYRMAEMLPGEYKLQATKDGYLPGKRGGVLLAGRVLTLNFVLERQETRTGAIVGKVTDGEGQPIPGATVAIVEGKSTTTGDLGRYELGGVLIGTYTLKASKTGYLPAVQRDVVVTEGQVTEVNFVLRRDGGGGGDLGRIFGKVRDGEGNPLAGVKVAIIAGPVLKEVLTNEAGAYALEELPAGTYKLRAGKEGYAPKETEPIALAAGQSREVNFTLSKSLGRIIGKVRKGEEQPIAEAKVEIVAGPVSGRTAFTNATGDYQLNELPAGTYALKFTKEGFKPLVVEGVVVGAGQTTVKNVTLQPAD